jgi:hypothetical protein
MIEATIECRCALGSLIADGQAYGELGFVEDVVSCFLGDRDAGDTVVVTYHVAIPEGHPLVGVDLDG